MRNINVWIRCALLTPDGTGVRHMSAEQSAALQVVAPLLQVLVRLHIDRIVHRDIKPENLFLTRKRQLKLGDLGLAIVAAEELPFTRSGTLDYMAPEVINPCRSHEQRFSGTHAHERCHPALQSSFLRPVHDHASMRFTRHNAVVTFLTPVYVHPAGAGQPQRGAAGGAGGDTGAAAGARHQALR